MCKISKLALLHLYDLPAFGFCFRSLDALKTHHPKDTKHPRMLGGANANLSVESKLKEVLGWVGFGSCGWHRELSDHPNGSGSCA